MLYGYAPATSTPNYAAMSQYMRPPYYYSNSLAQPYTSISSSASSNFAPNANQNGNPNHNTNGTMHPQVGQKRPLPSEFQNSAAAPRKPNGPVPPAQRFPGILSLDLSSVQRTDTGTCLHFPYLVSIIYICLFLLRQMSIKIRHCTFSKYGSFTLLWSLFVCPLLFSPTFPFWHHRVSFIFYVVFQYPFWHMLMCLSPIRRAVK